MIRDSIGFQKTQIPLTPFSKGGNWFLSIYFHSHLVLTGNMNVYSEKTTGMINQAPYKRIKNWRDAIYRIRLM